MTGRKVIRFNFHAESRRRQISTSTLFRAALTLIKTLSDLSEPLARGYARAHRKPFLFMFSSISRARHRRRLHRAVDVVFCRCPALLIFLEFRHDVPDWMRWLIFNGSQPPEWPALALLANSTLNLNSNVVKRATALETRDFSRAVSQRKTSITRKSILSGLLKLKSLRHNESIQQVILRVLWH